MKRKLIYIVFIACVLFFLFAKFLYPTLSKETLVDSINVNECIIIDRGKCEGFIKNYLSMDEKKLFKNFSKAIKSYDTYKFSQVCSVELKDTVKQIYYRIDLIDSNIFRYKGVF